MLGRDTLFYRLGNQQHDAQMTELVAKSRAIRERYGRSAPIAIHDVASILADMRLRKSTAELDSLRAACEVSAIGHAEAMRFARRGLYEYQVQAAMEFIWREGGSRRNGYPSIVASGPNAVILHYVENDREIEDGDLVLIDAAAEIEAEARRLGVDLASVTATGRHGRVTADDVRARSERPAGRASRPAPPPPTLPAGTPEPLRGHPLVPV